MVIFLIQTKGKSMIHMIVQPAFLSLSHFLKMDYLPATRYLSLKKAQFVLHPSSVENHRRGCVRALLPSAAGRQPYRLKMTLLLEDNLTT